MIVGGCTGGTAGGIKIPRLIFFIKNAKKSISKALNPRKNYYVKKSMGKLSRILPL